MKMSSAKQEAPEKRVPYASVASFVFFFFFLQEQFNL